MTAASTIGASVLTGSEIGSVGGPAGIGVGAGIGTLLGLGAYLAGKIF